MPPLGNKREGATPPPAPRGSSPTAPRRPSFRPRPGWIVFFLVLLALNVYISTRATEPPSRVRVPYSPFFLNQVRAGHVHSITSKGTAIQGTFTQNERYRGSKPTRMFRTEIPAFADTDALSKLLQAKNVTVNAEPLDTGPPWWQRLLLGFGPTLLFLLLLFFLLRRAKHAERPRRLRPVERTPLPAVRRQGHLRGRRRHQRGKGGATRGPRLSPHRA